MNRRRFLQALFAVPCLAAPLLVPADLCAAGCGRPERGWYGHTGNVRKGTALRYCGHTCRLEHEGGYMDGDWWVSGNWTLWAGAPT